MTESELTAKIAELESRITALESPKKSVTLPHIVSFWVSQADNDKITSACKRGGITVTDLCRELITSAPTDLSLPEGNERARHLTIHLSTADYEMLTEIAKMYDLPSQSAAAKRLMISCDNV